MKERIVCVEWTDACYNSGYYDKDKREFDPTKTKTVGFVIKSSRECMVLSHDRFYNDDKLEEERHITTIPRKMIRKVTELKR